MIAAHIVERHVRAALEEDLGDGDLTAGLIPPRARVRARVICREAAVIAGRPWFDGVFHTLDTQTRIHWHVDEGQAVEAGRLLCELSGNARVLLSGERSALNFLQTLSGTATRTRRYVEAVAGTGVTLLDTRKTLPGLREAQKYAVRQGGAQNHRHGLYDGILIKENHILAAGSIARALEAARKLGHDGLIEVEVENLTELEQALDAGAERILLDNMDPPSLRRAVSLTGGRATLEASGGITLDNIRQIAETGVDFISLGSLTKDVRAIDLSMRFEPLS